MNLYDVTQNPNRMASYGSISNRRGNYWVWLLVPFIIGLITVSNLAGIGRIMILYGLIVAGLFSIYFLYHRLSLQPEVIIFFVWVIWSLSGAFIAIDKAVYFTQLSTLIQVGVLIFIIAGITSLRRDMSAVMLAIWIGGFIVFISSVLNGELQQAARMGTRERAAGLVENSNEFSYNLLFVMISVFYALKRRSSVWWYIFLSMNVAVLCVGIVLSGSRSGTISAIMFMFLWWFFCKAKKLPKNPLKLLIILLLLISGIYFSVNYILNSTFLGKRIENIDDNSTRTRTELYIEGIDIIKKNTIFGVGLSNFGKLSGGLYSHSNYIELFASTGIIGFMLHYSIYTVLWLRFNRIQRMTDDADILYIVGILKASFLVILILSFADVIYYKKLVWIFLAGAIGYTWSIESILTRMKLYRENYLGIYEKI